MNHFTYADIFKTPTELVLKEVGWERSNQDAKWGVQNHDNGTHECYRAEAEDYKFVNAQRVERGVLSWLNILHEEVYEAFAETDPAKLRAELIQVAAVATCWIEAIDRRST